MNNKIWSLEDIKAVLKEIGEKMGMSCENVPVNISKRMTKCKGQYTCENNKELTPIKFTFAYNLINGSYNMSTVKQVIIHEYCHFYSNNYHMDSCNHDYRFKDSCRKAGISDSTYFEIVEEQEEQKEIIKEVTPVQVEKKKEIEIIETMDKIALQQMAQIELLNLQGKKNIQIIELGLIAQGNFNFKYDGNNLKTYGQWKNLGYQVQKGEKAILQVELWTPCKYNVSACKDGKESKNNNKDKKEEYTKMYLKKSSLFSVEQVKKA